MHPLCAVILAIAVTCSHQQSCGVQQLPEVFSAVRNTPVAASNVLPFSQILVDTAGGFDSSMTTYTAKSSGFYLMHFSAGVPPYQMLAYYLRNGSTTPGIFLSHTSYNGQLVSSRHDIQYVSENQSLYMSSEYPLYSDGLLQTTWSGFNLDTLMDSLVVFRAARTSNFTGSTVVFDEMLINVGQGWDECSGSQFVVPRAGIYFLSWISASVPKNGTLVYMSINGVIYSETINRAGYYPGIDTSSQTVLLFLNALDVITFVRDISYGAVYSDLYYPTSFTGFLYEPKHNQQVAWTLSFPRGEFIYLYGPTSVNFTEVALNAGSAWNVTSASIQIPVSGLYYLTLSGVSYPVEYKFNMILTLNGQAFINVKEEVDNSIKNIWFNVRSRSHIVHLERGDELVAIIPAGYNVYSYSRYTSFSGFLVQPEDVQLQRAVKQSSNNPSLYPARTSTNLSHQVNTCNVISVFSAARTSSYVMSAAQLPFNVILVDTENGFDSSKTYYTVQQAGYYMFHFSAGVPAFQRLNMALRNASSTPNIILTHTTFDDVVVTSRDDIQYVNEGQRLYISSDYPLMSDSMMQTSWSGLRLDGLYSPLVLFRAARTTAQQTIGDVTYDKMLINVGGGWDTCNSRFVAPRDGIYFFSWSSASVANTVHWLRLYLNNIALIDSPIYSGYYDGSDTASQSALLQLTAGDFVTLQSVSGSVYSDVNYQTSFLGFLYEPKTGEKAAWSLGFNGQAYGPTTIPFNSLLLLEGVMWNSTTRQLTILTAGTYYLKLSGVSYPLTYRFRMGLIVNSQPEPLMSVMDDVTSLIRTQYYTERTRALITNLQQGDSLEVGVPAGYEAGHDDYNEVLFAGFRVY